MTTWYAYGSGRKGKTAGWTHGSEHDFDKFSMDGDPHGDWDTDKHWNCHIGPHFTSLHSVAEQFANKSGHDQDEYPGHIYHIGLDMKNPKHYDSEHDMDEEAHEHAKKWRLLDCDKEHARGGHADCLRDAYDENTEEARGPEIADSFREHLKRHGHDGITYGNEHEGPKRHKCAIAFNPSQIKVYSQHSADQICPHGEDDEDSHEEKKPYQPPPIPGQQKLDYGKMATLDLVHFFKEAAGEHETWYHLTEDPNFSLNKEHAPEDNALSIQDRSGKKGLYVAPHDKVDNWWSPAGQGYSRPYVAEVHVPKGTAKPSRWGGEHFIHADDFDKAKVHQVKPWDAHVREQFGDHGHIESHHGTEFDTGKPLRKDPERPHRPFGDSYKYTGDTRKMSPEEQQHHQQRWQGYMKDQHGWDDEDFRKEGAAQGEDELPPEPGTTPIPEGHIRLYHYTRPEHLDSIKEHGLKESHARGDGGLGAGNEPSAGVWASTKPPKDAPHFVEFHAHPDEISDRAESTRGYTPEEFQKGNHHVIMRGDVKPEQFVAIHEPWHGHARYILNSPDALEATKRGENDAAMEMPDYAKAITHVKKHGAFEDERGHEFGPEDRKPQDPDNFYGISDHTTHVPTSVLLPYKVKDRTADPRDPKRMDALRADIAEHGIGNPIALFHDGKNATIAEGEHRLDVAKEQGITHVPTRIIRLKHLHEISEFAKDGKPVSEDLHPHLDSNNKTASKTAGAPLKFYPAKHGGKYHLRTPIAETARCRGSVEVDSGEPPIHVAPDQERIHPIVCKRCLALGRAAHGRGEHVASLAPGYRLQYGVSDEGHHIIDAYHGKHDVGSAVFDPDGTLNELNVNPEHQRKGLATAMWEHAKSLGINPQHSNVRSRQGDAWAKSTGDPVPENLWPSHPDDDDDDVQNQTFSTAFTAPGYHHPYTSEDFPKALGYERKPHTAALHDVSSPDTFHLYDSWGKSDEEKAANAQKAKDLNDQFHKDVIREGGLPEDTPKHEAENHWKRAMAHALTTGKKTIDEAEAQGYRGDNREHGEKVSTYENYYDKDKPRRGGYQNLSAHQSHFYHVGTDADAIQNEGLKTRREQGINVGHGLGGGSDDTVSVTDDHDLATDIYHSLHEHHAAVNGKITPQQLYDYAKNPPKGEPFHKQLVKPGSHQEGDFDRLKRGVVQNGPYTGGPEGWANPNDLSDEHKAEGWKPSGDPVSGPNHPNHPVYEHFERPATDEEMVRKRSEFYKNFSTYRHHAGGHRDPLFISHDPVKFSKADPEKFGILALKPHPKAQGYPLDPNKGHHDRADSGEWRLGPGSPFDVTHVNKPYPRHEEEFDNYPATKSGDVGKVASAEEPETHSIYRGLYLGSERHQNPMGKDVTDEQVMDRLKQHHDWRVKTNQIDAPGVNPNEERRAMFGPHWTEDHRLAHKFAFDNQHGKYRAPRLPRHGTVGVVLEAKTKTKPEQDRLGSQFGETEVKWPGRSNIDSVTAHVHYYHPDMRRMRPEDTHLRSFELPKEMLTKHSAAEPAYRGVMLNTGGRGDQEPDFTNPKTVLDHMRPKKGEGNPLYGPYWTKDKEQAKHFSTGTHSLSYVWGFGVERKHPIHGVVLEAHLPHREHQEDESPFLYPSEQGVLGPYKQDKPKIRAHVYRLDPDKKDHEQEHLHSFDVPDSHWTKHSSLSDSSSDCHCASCNSLGMIPPGSDCVARKTAAAEDWGGKENWKPGETAHFEYHCYEGHDSDDAQAWYHSHRKVKVLAPGKGDGWNGDWKDSTHAERADAGMPRTYTVQHDDGFKHDAFEDELLTHPKHFYRPDPPKPPKTASVQGHHYIDSQGEHPIDPDEHHYGMTGVENVRKGDLFRYGFHEGTDMPFMRAHGDAHPDEGYPSHYLEDGQKMWLIKTERGFTPHQVDHSRMEVYRPRKAKTAAYTHYTDHEFEPGDEVLPSSQTGRKSTQGHPFAYMSDKVYMAGDGHDPVTYRQHGKNAYEVEPVGKVERDYEFDYAKSQYEDAGDLGGEPGQPVSDEDIPGYHSYQAPKARVVRKMATVDLLEFFSLNG